MKRAIGVAIGVAFLACWVLACTPGARSPRAEQAPDRGPAPRATLVDPTNPAEMDPMLDRLAAPRVVLVGERHDRYDHHLNQLAVIRGLDTRGVPLAVGLEAFQSPFQTWLDAYVAGRIDERELVERTEYATRWGFDFRLYRDILRYARERDIPLVALGAPAELVQRVSGEGLATLSPPERRGLVLATPGGEASYAERLRPVFSAHHGRGDSADLQRFADVQRFWDAYMARTASDYLAAHPDRHLVLLAGAGHIAHRNAIPGRLRGLEEDGYAILATGLPEARDRVSIDYLLVQRDLPPPGPASGLHPPI